VDGTGQWSFTDAQLDRGPFVLKLIIANKSCNKAILAMKPDRDGTVFAQDLPDQCLVADERHVTMKR
jgi:hypothetical protein